MIVIGNRKELLHTKDSVERVTGAAKPAPTHLTQQKSNKEWNQDFQWRENLQKKNLCELCKAPAAPSAFQTNPEAETNPRGSWQCPRLAKPVLRPRSWNLISSEPFLDALKSWSGANSNLLPVPSARHRQNPGAVLPKLSQWAGQVSPWIWGMWNRLGQGFMEQKHSCATVSMLTAGTLIVFCKRKLQELEGSACWWI